MTWRDKLEIGLKENAPYRKDNLPLSEIVGPEIPQGPGRSAEIPRARETPTKIPPISRRPMARGTSRRPGRSVRRGSRPA
jgi:hypothetical protein